MMLMMMVRMMIWNEKVSATVVWRWKCRDMLNNRHWSFTLENMSLPADTAATADICGQLVLTADSGLQSAMTVPGQRSTTERATAAHHLDDARQISIHSAFLARNRSRQPRLQSTRPRNTAATTHKVRHLTKGAQRLRMFWPGPGRACCCCDPCKGGSEGQGSFWPKKRSLTFWASLAGIATAPCSARSGCESANKCMPPANFGSLQTAVRQQTCLAASCRVSVGRCCLFGWGLAPAFLQACRTAVASPARPWSISLARAAAGPLNWQELRCSRSALSVAPALDSNTVTRTKSAHLSPRCYAQPQGHWNELLHHDHLSPLCQVVLPWLGPQGRVTQSSGKRWTVFKFRCIV